MRWVHGIDLCQRQRIVAFYHDLSIELAKVLVQVVGKGVVVIDKQQHGMDWRYGKAVMIKHTPDKFSPV